MSKAYKEIMEKVEVTEEMRSRILQNIETRTANTNASRSGRHGNHRLSKTYKYLSIAACLVLLLIGAAALPKILENGEPGPDVELGYPTGSITECSSAEELSKAVGFTVKDPEALSDGSYSISYINYWNEMAEIQYSNNLQTITLRKAQGSEDISGDYNEYALIRDIDHNSIAICLKGNDELYNLAIWSYEGYSYSLYFSEGVSESDILSVIEQVQ